MAAGEIIVTAANKAIYLASLDAIDNGSYPTSEEKSEVMRVVLDAMITAVVPDGGAVAGNVVITAANQILYLARLKAAQIEGGDFSSPEQRSDELANLVLELVTAVTVT